MQARQKEQASATPASSGEASPGNTGELILLLTIEDAGKALGVGRSTIYELLHSGDLEVVHIRRAARIPVDSVHDYVRRLRCG